MARNTLAGKRTGKSKSAKHYAKNKKSRDKKKAYDTEYHKTKKRKKYRAFLNKRTYGNKDGMDLSHTKKGKVVKEKKSKNRARNRGKK
jgi:hypothetical protein